MICPITPQMLRDDWPGRTDLTSTQSALLGTLSDAELQRALEDAYLRADYQDVWDNLFDVVGGAATRDLVEHLPDPKRARKGTKDVCTECGLPITAETGGGWTDDIMGSNACPKGGEHSPTEALRKLQEMLKAAQATPRSDRSTVWVLVTMTDSESVATLWSSAAEAYGCLRDNFLDGDTMIADEDVVTTILTHQGDVNILIDEIELP